MQYRNAYGIVGHKSARVAEDRPTGLVGLISEALGRVRLHLGERARFVRTRDELAALSDRELADVGLKRAEIEGIARHAARHF